MSQDYAKKKPKAPAKKTQSSLPAWFWLFTGIISGLFFAFLIYLSGISVEGEKLEEAKDETSELTEQIKQQAERLREGKDALKKPEFTFYQRLPELIITTPKPNETPKGSSKARKSYYLQAGSFKSYQDADALKAQLIMQGLDVRVHSVKNKQGQSWHRVQVGPYKSENKINKAKDVLANNDIQSMLIEDK